MPADKTIVYPIVVKEGPLGELSLYNRYQERIYRIFLDIHTIETQDGNENPRTGNELRRMLRNRLDPRLFTKKQVLKHDLLLPRIEIYFRNRDITCDSDPNVEFGHHLAAQLINEIWTGKAFEFEKSIAYTRFRRYREAMQANSENSFGDESASSVHPAPPPAPPPNVTEPTDNPTAPAVSPEFPPHTPVTVLTRLRTTARDSAMRYAHGTSAVHTPLTAVPADCNGYSSNAKLKCHGKASTRADRPPLLFTHSSPLMYSCLRAGL